MAGTDILARTMTVLAVSFTATDDLRSIDEAFLWEPEQERRPLVTFGQLRRLSRIVRDWDAAAFDRAVVEARSIQGGDGAVANDR